MKNEINITVELFGALRNLNDNFMINFSVPKGSFPGDIRKHLKDAFQGCAESDIQIIDQSVFGLGEKLLSENESIEEDANLVILPPVCGG